MSMIIRAIELDGDAATYFVTSTAEAAERVARSRKHWASWQLFTVALDCGKAAIEKRADAYVRTPDQVGLDEWAEAMAKWPKAA